MDIANNWTIVIGVATIVSMILLWSKQAYLDPIREREEDIIRKVKEDIKEKLTNSNKLIEEKGEEKFVDEIYDIIEFKKFFRELKESFGRRMIPSGIAICFLAAIFVSTWNFFPSNILLAYIMLFPIFLIFTDFMKMRKYENFLSRYLEGEDPSSIGRKN